MIRSRASAPAVVVVAATVAGAALIAASAVVHLYLWGKTDGYRTVPTVGWLFLLQGIVGCVLALAIVATRRWYVSGAGAAYMAASVGGLVLSINGGLFGYDETVDAPWVRFSLVVEIAGFLALLVVALLGLGRRVEGHRV